MKRLSYIEDARCLKVKTPRSKSQDNIKSVVCDRPTGCEALQWLKSLRTALLDATGNGRRRDAASMYAAR